MNDGGGVGTDESGLEMWERDRLSGRGWRFMRDVLRVTASLRQTPARALAEELMQASAVATMPYDGELPIIAFDEAIGYIEALLLHEQIAAADVLTPLLSEAHALRRLHRQLVA